jgi:hypothetical protein
MATKLTGLDDLGFTTTAGDTGTLVTDGSLTIGNADTDNVVFNADIKSHMIPDDAATYHLGSGLKPWSIVYVSEGIVRRSQIGDGYTTLGFVDPNATTNVITVPAITGTLAVEGLLPSYLAFGKSGTQSAPVTDYELTTVNGSQNAQGWRMPVAGLVTNMSCQFEATATGNQNGFVLALWKNGVLQSGYDITLNGLASGDNGASLAFPNPLAFAANDRLTLKMSLTVGGGASLSVNDLACLLRVLN